MDVHALDDLPFHQHAAPFHMLATSDPHFNDGYFFAAYSEEFYVIAGLRLHPNTNTIDGFASLAHGGEQRCVRVSRALHPAYGDLTVGPLGMKIVEPMVRQHLKLADGTGADFSFDLEWTARAPAFAETRYTHHKYGRVINDTLRYTQVCRCAGTLRIDGRDVSVDSWHAMRDHSWGIRSSMGPPTRFGGTDRAHRDPRAFRLWVPFECGDHCGFINTHEDADGNPVDFEGRLDFADGRSVELTGVDHRIEYVDGLPASATMSLSDIDGVIRHYEVRVSGTPADVQGLGYHGGWNDSGSAGVYRGPETVEVDRYPSATGAERTGPAHIPIDKRLGATEFPVTITGPGDTRGMAHFEHTIIGRAGVSGASRHHGSSAPA